VRLGSCSETAFGFLKACVLARANIVVSGGTGSGKTTLLNVLSGYLPDDERIVTIEDAAELQLRQRHVARLEARPAGSNGKEISEVTGMEEDVITMQEAFRFVRSGMDSQGRVVGRFTASGVRPRVLDRLDELGLEMPSEIQSLFHESVHQAL